MWLSMAGFARESEIKCKVIMLMNWHLRLSVLASFATVASLALLALAGEHGGYLIFVSNERSADVTIIDGTTSSVVATVPAGKRPRGIHVSPDGRRIYLVLSGS